MSPSAANGVVPPAIDSACITSTVGFMMNSPGLFTWPMTYTLLPLISWIDTVTTGIGDELREPLAHRLVEVGDGLALGIDLADQRKRERAVRAARAPAVCRSGSFHTLIDSMSPGLTV